MTTKHTGLFRIATILTIIWISGAVYIAGAVHFGWSAINVTSLLKVPPQDPLSLNELGDFLAGVSAPIAFGWFFISTWLQRDELNETRKELAKQAEESANQTKIMQVRAEYDEHRQRLYYLAAYLMREGKNISLVTSGLNTVPLIHPTGAKLSEENVSVDAIIDQLGESQSHALNFLSPPDIEPLQRVPMMSAALDWVADELVALVRSERYRTNPLVLARIKGAGLDQITNNAEALADKIREYLVRDA